MKVLTANRLFDGEAVWLAADHSWAETLQAAQVARDPAEEERLAALGRLSAARNEVVEVELIDVHLVEGGIVPARLRERIRAAGPTVRGDLGKQARAVSALAAA